MTPPTRTSDVSGSAPEAIEPTVDFTALVGAAKPAYLADHTYRGRPFLPAASYLALAFAAAGRLYGDPTRPVHEVRFVSACFLDPAPRPLRTRIRPCTDGRALLEFGAPAADPAASDGSTVVHATAKLGTAVEPPTGPLSAWGAALLARARQALGRAPERVLGAADVYEVFRGSGMVYGPQFSRVQTVRRYGPDLALGTISARDADPGEFVPVQLLDGATHALAAVVDTGHAYVSTGIDYVRALRSPAAAVLDSAVALRGAEGGGADFLLDVLLLEGTEPVAELAGMRFKRIGGHG